MGSIIVKSVKKCFNKLLKDHLVSLRGTSVSQIRVYYYYQYLFESADGGMTPIDTSAIRLIDLLCLPHLDLCNSMALKFSLAFGRVLSCSE